MRGADGVDRVVVAVQMANGGDFVKAKVALNQFKATSARGPRRPLSYANVRSVQVRMRATGMGTMTVDLPRAADRPQLLGPATRHPPTPPRRRGPGAPPGRRRQRQLRSFDVLHQRRGTRRFGQQPDLGSRRRPPERRWGRLGRGHRSRRAPRPRVDRRVAPDREDREIDDSAGRPSRCSSSSARRIRSSSS